MGDAADQLIEAGLLALVLHNMGECGCNGSCQYCEGEAEESEELISPIEELEEE